MRKLTCYAWSWCILLAGASTVLAGQDTLPPPPAPAGAVGAPAANHDPIPVPDATLSAPNADGNNTTVSNAGTNNAPASTAPCPADNYRRGSVCHHGVSCYGIKPLGACVCAQVCTQVNNGIAAQMVLYNYDFNDPTVGDPTKLSLYGLRRLGQMERWLRAGNICPVTIEQTLGNPTLDSARQMHVITVLGEAGLAPQVAIGDAPAGLIGAEALLIHESRLQQISAGGATFNRQSTSSSGGSNNGSSSSSGQGASQ